MKTYLITGGAGFIGSSLLERLSKNNKIIILDNLDEYYSTKTKINNIKNYIENENVIFYKGDIRDKEMLNIIFSCNQIDCVIHLAALAGVRNSIINPLAYNDVNCTGTLNLLETMKNYLVKNIIFISSSSVYGNCDSKMFSEDMNTKSLISPYAATKKYGEELTYIYHELYNIDAIVLRLFTVYGPKQRPDLAITKFTNLILNDKPVDMYGDGNTYRDYTYIDDTVNGIISAIKYLEKNSNVYEIINIGNSNPIRLLDMINILGQKLNKHVIINRKNYQLGDVNYTCADITKARELLGYEPTISFEEGIEKFVKSLKISK